MAVTYQFDGQEIVIPDAYGTIKSAITNPNVALEYGNVILIDTGVNHQGYSWGAGIDGQLAVNKDTIYNFKNYEDFVAKVRGGTFWSTAYKLWFPDKDLSVKGINRLYYIKAAKTTCATIPLVFANGKVDIYTRSEGLAGNGVMSKKDPTATFTLTDAGDGYDLVEAQAGNVLTTIASYETKPGDTIPDIIAALCANLQANSSTTGYYLLSSTDNSFTIGPAEGTGEAGNGIPVGWKFTDTIPSGQQSIYHGNALGGGFLSALPDGYTSGTFAGGIDSFDLIKGYGVEPLEGTKPGTLKFAFKAGLYKGVDPEGEPWDFVTIDELPESETLFTTPDFKSITEFVNYMGKDATFNSWFAIKSATTTDGAGGIFVPATDIANNPGIIPAAGGAEVYSTTALAKVLSIVADLDYNFVFCDTYGTDPITGAQSVSNTMIQQHIKTKAKYKKYMFVAGGKDENEFNTTPGTIGTANYYDDNQVIVTHAGLRTVRKSTSLTPTYKNYDSIHKMAEILGRTCGVSPQTPITFKTIRMDKDMHEMTVDQMTLALKNGVVFTRWDADLGTYIIAQGITTLQGNKNIFEVNNDGTSHELSIERIGAYLNRLMLFNFKVAMLSNKNQGPNRAVLTPASVAAWVKRFLLDQQAKPGEDGLILSAQNIKVVAQGDAYFVTYEFVPNFPVNKFFFTGYMIDQTVTINV